MAFNARIQTRRDTASNWETKNPVLLEGELIIVTTNAGDTRFKIGDGKKTYTQLPFQDESLYNVLSGKADRDNVVILEGGATATVSEIFGEGPYTIEFTDEADEVLSAGWIDYDNTTSGLAATTVQGAIDELKTTLSSSESTSGIVDQNSGELIKLWHGTSAEYDDIAEKDEDTIYILNDEVGGDTEATDIVYDGTVSGLTATNVQDAIDELQSALGNVDFTETDPTVPAWAKAASKPSYTADEVGAAPASHNQAAGTITAGTFAGQVVANSSGETYSTYLLRNTRLASSDTNPSVNGEICWTYG